MTTKKITKKPTPAVKPEAINAVWKEIDLKTFAAQHMLPIQTLLSKLSEIRHLEIIDLILADKKLEAIALLRKPVEAPKVKRWTIEPSKPEEQKK